jgi:hypothetical protein
LRPRSSDPGTVRGDETDLDPQASQQVDESIGAEELDATAQQVADSRLTDSQELGGLSLLEAPRSKFLLEPDHQVGAHQKVLGPFGSEPEVAEHVPA